MVIKGPPVGVPSLRVSNQFIGNFRMIKLQTIHPERQLPTLRNGAPAVEEGSRLLPIYAEALVGKAGL